MQCQLEIKNKSLKPLFELHDGKKLGKIDCDTFNQIMRENSNGSGLDLWIDQQTIETIMLMLDPQQISDKVDYGVLMFYLEK